jgi:hypothetical protein
VLVRYQTFQSSARLFAASRGHGLAGGSPLRSFFDGKLHREPQPTP